MDRIYRERALKPLAHVGRFAQVAHPYHINQEHRFSNLRLGLYTPETQPHGIALRHLQAGDPRDRHSGCAVWGLRLIRAAARRRRWAGIRWVLEYTRLSAGRRFVWVKWNLLLDPTGNIDLLRPLHWRWSGKVLFL